MILQALKGYYDRLAADPESGIAPEGWIQSGIDFLIELDEAGRYRGIECLQEQTGKKKTPKPMLVPNIGKQASKHTMSGDDGNLLWDNASFVLGLGKNGDLHLQSMIDAIDARFQKGDDKEIDAVRAFLAAGLANRQTFEKILKDPEYGELLEIKQPRMTFRIAGSPHRTVLDSPALKKALSQVIPDEDEVRGVCLVTGEPDVSIEKTHPAIKNVWGAQSSGAYIVSFNAPSFEYYKKKQSTNAPISK